MYVRKIEVQYEAGDQWQPVPLKWLDNFAMRNFTNEPVFDDTLPSADGQMEIGKRVPLERLKKAMEDWFRRKGYIGKDKQLSITESA